jgi:PAS domain S-box-containing protein
MAIGVGKSLGSFDAAGRCPAHDRRGHAALFYGQDQVFMGSMLRFVRAALDGGFPAIVIGTQAHLDKLANLLEGEGHDIGRLCRQGMYVQMGAAETSSQFLVDDTPDSRRFSDLIGGVLARVKQAAENDKCVAVAAEMSAYLWMQGKAAAAMRLEQLWNDLAETYSFSLCCLYPIGSFSRKEDGLHLMKICTEHRIVIPSEGNATVPGAGQRPAEERFRILLDSLQDHAVLTLDPEGRVTSWNAGAKRVTGYHDFEVMGQHFSRFYLEEDLDSGKLEQALQRAAAEGQYEEEGWRLRNDGSKFWANTVLTVLRDNDGRLIGFAGVTRDITERMLKQQTLRETQRDIVESEQSLRRLSLHLLQSQDEERRRFGKDLHDNLGQYLSALKMELESLQLFAKKGGEGNASDELAECIRLAKASIEEFRTLSQSLYPPMLEDMGLRSAIPWYLEAFTKHSGIKTTLQISPELRRFSSDVELALFRVLQEALVNVERHSGSATADLQLFLRNGNVVLKVSDAGKGIPWEILGQADRRQLFATGVGLRGMNERMKQLRGRLDLTSSKQGTTVIATIPIAVQQIAKGASAAR